MFTADPPASATGVGVGYGIAIAVSILFLISAIMLASYACVKVKGASATTRPHEDRSVAYNNVYGHRSRSEAVNSNDPVVVVMGLDGPTIDSYPKLVLGESRRLPQRNYTVCSICLSEYKPGDQVRCIPDCHHCFHAECVDEWLRMSATCPSVEILRLPRWVLVLCPIWCRWHSIPGDIMIFLIKIFALFLNLINKTKQKLLLH
ncbi:RING/U-box superfamily protein [Prunus dulcis]|uniref:RING/U-box superfamily protein n=1 Tax=Prunus dulcis TaxID=3755 RepID=A0A5H2Y117_PRUDU|nr:RING/U-box superfamily protein [Prunus dulcis]